MCNLLFQGWNEKDEKEHEEVESGKEVSLSTISFDDNSDCIYNQCSYAKSMQ
jgi:hypothetical protein